MKVKAICIENVEKVSSQRFKHDLTIGKIYDLTLSQIKWSESTSKPLAELLNSQCEVESDSGSVILVSKKLFKMMDEHRKEQIEQLLK